MTFYCLLCPANFKDLPLLLDHAEEHNQKGLREAMGTEIPYLFRPPKIHRFRRRPHGYRRN